jgi:hypothetical protein
MDWIVPIAVCTFVTVLLFATFAFVRKQKVKANTDQFSDLPLSLPPPSEAPKVPSLTQREQMEEELNKVRTQGRCVICGGAGEKATPKLVPKKSILDWLHRKLNAIAPQRREIQEEFDPTVPLDLCRDCQPMARAHVNAFMVDQQLEAAGLVEKQNHACREFQRYGLYERMRENANAIKRGRKKRQPPTLAVVPMTKAVNGQG